MPKPAPPLVERLLRELAACRAEGGGGYPVSLTALAARLSPQPGADALLKAAKEKAFTARAVAAAKGRADAPVALLEDAELLAAAPATLELALRAKGASGPPPWTVAELAKAVSTVLQPALKKYLARALTDGTLHDYVIRVGSGRNTKLHHRDQHLPRPPEEEDAERLVDQLQRTIEPGASTTATELQRLAGLKQKAFDKAIKQKAFVDVALVLKAGDTFLLPRASEFARFVYGTLLPRLLAACPRAKAHAFAAAELVAHLKDKEQQKQMAVLLNRTELGDELPDGIGCVLASTEKGPAKNVFFALEHLRRAKGASVPNAPPAPSAAAGDFARAFDEAFARLDRERGSNNFVSLVDLRAALPAVPRAAFDAALHELRVSRRYILNSAEHSEGLGPDQREAAIREEGEFLLHVSRGRQ
jgi:hypothetical protein